MNAKEEGATLLVNDINEITADNAGEFAETITENTTQDTRTIDIDLSSATFLDNIGLGTLVSVHKQAREGNRRVRIIKPTTNVIEILEFTNLHQKFELVL